MTPLRHITLLLSVALTSASAKNVLLITSDDLGLQLGCYGETTIETPNLDALAAGATLFEIAYVTQASCSSSRSSIFTGLLPHTNGQLGLLNRGFSMKPAMAERAFPAALEAAGYRNGIIGKLHVGPEKKMRSPFSTLQANTRDVRKVAQLAGDFMAAPGEAPFFLMVNYSDPHVSRDKEKKGPQFFERQHKGIPEDPIGTDAAPAWPFQKVGGKKALARIANYFNCVQRVDVGVGLLLEALEKSGNSQETLVLFCSDHGPPFARAKTSCYEAGLRVPFIVRWPGVATGGLRSEALVSTLDIAPTIFDFTGVKPPSGTLHGRSLRPVCAGDTDGWRKYLFAEHHYHGDKPFFPRRAVRDGRYKLIHNLVAGRSNAPVGIDGDPAFSIAMLKKHEGSPAAEAFARLKSPPEFEVFDLESDPNEFRNLAGRPEFASVEGELKAALLEWRKQTGDPFLDPAVIGEHLAK